MNILKYEYKAHRLIKIIFYLISFVLGFLIGVGVKELKINSILCTLLGIENVQAKTLTVDYTNPTFTEIRRNYDLDDRLNYLEENFIKPKFNKVFNQYAIIYYSGELYVFLANGTLSSPYIFQFEYGGTWAGYNWSFNSNVTGPTGYLKIPLDTDFEKTVSSLSSYDTMSSDWLLDYKPKNAGSMFFFSTGNAGYIYPIPIPSNEYYIPFDVNFPMFLDGSHELRYTLNTSNKGDIVVKFFDKDYTTNSCLNGDCLKVSNGIPSYYEYLSEEIGYFKELEFNENVFANDDNFNKYCVESDKAFSITADSSALLENGSYFRNDFLWFPYHLTGLYMSEYTSESFGDDTDNIRIFNDEVSTDHFWFSGRVVINNIFSDEVDSNYFIHGGYTNKFDYYGYSAYKFSYSYLNEDGKIRTFFPVYTFNQPSVSYIDNVNLLPSYKFDDDIYNNKYCFYLKKPFVVNYLKRDSFGDFYGEVVTPEGNIDINTSYNKNRYDNSSSFNSIISFITNIGGELGFIKDTVLDFFSSMPTLLQLFILAIFNVLLIKIIIGMVTR